MIYLALPLGTTHGWGVAGRMITRELAKISPLQLFTEPLLPELLSDEFEARFLRTLLPPGSNPTRPSPGGPVDGPVLRGIPSLAEEYYPALRGTFTVGYTFFEDDVRLRAQVKGPISQFDHLVAGSTWCADALRNVGLKDVSVILQGIDPRVFNAHMNEKQFFADQFVVFSGGKLELRKGQDLVIAALRVLQQRHKDVLFVNAWTNPFHWTVASMAASRYIKLPSVSGPHVEVTNYLLSQNGIDVSRCITLDRKPNPLMAQIYKNTDIGVFPNRCEGGSNLVLCEYMACGKPVVASFNTGHCDVLSDENSLPLRKMTSSSIRDDRRNEIAVWYDPDVDEIVERLEWAYQNRDALRALGQRAADDMSKLTWESTAGQFYRLLTRSA